MNNVTKSIDWESVRWEFENTKISMRKLAKKYGTYPMDISRKAKEFCWEKFNENKKEKNKTTKKKHVNPEGILSTVAVRKIEEIVEELGDEYSPVDEPLIVAYAEDYQRYLKLVSIVNEEGETCISPKTGAAYMNPNFSALMAVKSSLTKIGDRLGLSIAARKRLNIKLGREEKTKSLFDFIDDVKDFNEDIDV